MGTYCLLIPFEPKHSLPGAVDKDGMQTHVRYPDKVGAVLDDRGEHLQFRLGAVALADVLSYCGDECGFAGLPVRNHEATAMQRKDLSRLEVSPQSLTLQLSPLHEQRNQFFACCKFCLVSKARKYIGPSDVFFTLQPK